MPTYEYQCLSFGHRIEVVQSFEDEPLRICPECGGPLRRVFHPVGIVLKGSGFYSTDNRAGSKRRAASESKKEGGSEAKPAETKKESKPESTTSSESSSSKKKSDDTSKK